MRWRPWSRRPPPPSGPHKDYSASRGASPRLMLAWQPARTMACTILHVAAAGARCMHGEHVALCSHAKRKPIDWRDQRGRQHDAQTLISSDSVQPPQLVCCTWQGRCGKSSMGPAPSASTIPSHCRLRARGRSARCRGQRRRLHCCCCLCPPHWQPPPPLQPRVQARTGAPETGHRSGQTQGDLVQGIYVSCYIMHIWLEAEF